MVRFLRSRVPSWLLLSALSAACAPGEAHAPDAGERTAQWRVLAQDAPALRPPAGARRLGRSGSPTAVLADVGGWDDPALRPTNRSTAIAAASDGRVALMWLHNADPGGPPDGEPITYASVGDPLKPESFTAATPLSTRPFDDGPLAFARRRHYNAAHNAPFICATRAGGFIGLSVPMNANGYAQGRPATGFAYAENRWSPKAGRWSAPALCALASPMAGASLSEISGGQGPDGTLHLVGQGHLGRFQGALGYQRWRPVQARGESLTLASAHRPGKLTYFVEGAMAVAPDGALHVAFAWNQQGAMPMFGLYYLVSRDGGRRWQTAHGRHVTLPLEAGRSAEAAAVVPAALSARGYGGASAGVHSLSVAVAPDGAPVIVRSRFVGPDRKQTQTEVFTRTGGRWVSAPVGPPLFWNQGGTGVAVSRRTQRVNVLLLDPGGPKRPGQVYRYDAPLSALRRGKAWWHRQVVGEAPNAHGYASSLKVATVGDQRFVFVFEPSYRNPGRVSPVLGVAPLK